MVSYQSMMGLAHGAGSPSLFAVPARIPPQQQDRCYSPPALLFPVSV